MNYTPNFHLPQWDKDDRIMMDDFNQMTSALEGALSQSQQAVQATQMVAATAQQSADGAQTTATEALQTAKGRLFFRMGMYTGFGGSSTIPTFDDIPWIVFISGKPISATQADTHRYTGMLVGGTKTACGHIDNHEFTVTDVDRADCPRLNAPDCVYQYIVLCT